MTTLSLDYGKKNVGLAIGDSTSRAITPLKAINNIQSKDNLWNRLDKTVYEWEPDDLLLGLPTTLDESQHPLKIEICNFGEEISKRYNLEVNFIDEYLSSHAAAIERKKRQNKKFDLDSLAAAFILETWFDCFDNKERC